MRNKFSITAFAGKYYFFLLLLVLILCKIAIVSPGFPRYGLDPSWQFALSVASDNHFVFGKDIIYTFGPLINVDTGTWSLHSHGLSVFLSILIAAALSLFVYKFFQKSNFLVKLLLLIFFFVNLSSARDFFYCLLPALASLTAIKSYSDKNSTSNLVYAVLLGFIAALLLLVKLSFGVESLICLIILLIFYAAKKDKVSLVALAAGFLVSFIILYLAAGQNIQDIFYYPLNIYYGVSGYNDAMSNPGPVVPVIASSIFLLLLMSYLAFRSLNPCNIKGIFSLLVISLLSLVVFKHSYVRNDSGHAADIYLFESFLLIYLLNDIDGRLKPVFKNILITCCVWSLFCFGSQNDSVFFSGSQIKRSYEDFVSRAENVDRIFNEDRNKVDFENNLKIVSQVSPLPSLKGTSDIYNYNQAVLLASGNTWNLRPAFQSYQAVTPYLAKVNYDHLVKQDTAPDNIFFRLETIDGRFPSLDDGLSWKALLGLYKPTGWTENNDYLILKRDDAPGNVLQAKSTKNIVGRIGQEIVNPYENGLVFLKLHMRKSMLGKLITVVYKTDPVWLQLKLQNGQEMKFRIIPPMCETGFLVSPLTLSTADFSSLYESGYFPDSDIGLRVRSLAIIPENPNQYLDSFDVTFEQLEHPERSKAIVHKFQQTITEFKDVIVDPSIKYNVDSFTFRFTDDRKLILSLHGWAFKKNETIQNSKFAMLFIDEKGNCLQIPLLNAQRHDVSSYFNDGHDYDKSGYITSGIFDSSELQRKTEYKVYLKMIINQAEYVVPLDRTLPVS